jgi:predicted house-cleaning noncanonical NTP pyrophosphatase (MazG superfamily)
VRKFKFNKLVRDGIKPEMESKGVKVSYKILKTKQEYITHLLLKLEEESQEALKDLNLEELKKELADIQEVVDAIKVELEVPDEVLNSERRRKNAKAGKFDTRTFIDTVEVPDDYPWINYYLESPDKYPEIFE